MSRLRCPHCATLLPQTNSTEDEAWGCPGCGVAFAVRAKHSDGRIMQMVQRRFAVPAANKLDDVYPPGPEDVPDDLTIPGTNYQLGVLLLLCTLILFAFVYVGLLICSGCMIFWPLRWFHLWGLPLSFVSFIVFLYLLKGFFKSNEEDESARVEITEAEQPLLFAFIEQLCEEVGAPTPHRVFLEADVNAMAGYEHSVLGLLRPVPKNLVLGLGLLNVLTLSELKAVLAHEFGHFSQSSMKLGVYAYVFNDILYNVVRGRDWFDTFLLQHRSRDTMVGLFAKICWGIVSAMRLAMTGLFLAINFLERWLSRQMEFHADLVAVSRQRQRGHCPRLVADGLCRLISGDRRRRPQVGSGPRSLQSRFVRPSSGRHDPLAAGERRPEPGPAAAAAGRSAARP